MTPARRRLTAAQQELALTAERWIAAEARLAPRWLRRLWGDDVLLSEAWVAVCKAAAEFDSARHPGVPFGAYARRGVRMHFRGLRRRDGRRLPLWSPDRHAGGADVSRTALEPDRRAPGSEDDSLLALWCRPDYAEQRRGLDWRSRVVLYLRTVECLTLRELGAAVGLTAERCRQIEGNAVAHLARRRADALARREIGRQLERGAA